MAEVTAARDGRPSTEEIARRGGAAVVLSVAVNAVVLGASLVVLDVPPAFEPLSWGPVVGLSALGAAAATAVYAVLVRRYDDHDERFRDLARVVLFASFVPDLLVLPGSPGATAPAIAVLLFMHVVVAAACLGSLTRVEL